MKISPGVGVAVFYPEDQLDGAARHYRTVDFRARMVLKLAK